MSSGNVDASSDHLHRALTPVLTQGFQLARRSRPMSRHRTILLLEPLEQRFVCSAGDLDPAFNGTGMQHVDVGNLLGGSEGVPASIALQQDGKILLAGLAAPSTQPFVARLNPDGSLDQTFGNNGIAMISFPEFIGVAAVAVEPEWGDRRGGHV
jgi:hypothetical protein